MRVLVLLAAWSVLVAVAREARPADSHPPMRALPRPSTDALPDGPTRFVHPTAGDDAFDGSLERPWKTLAHALAQLRPGDTLVLRGGVYYEQVTVSCAGTEGHPIVVRSHPGELAILDGGLREFAESPGDAWMPAPEGAEGEYVSTNTYSAFDGVVLGSFADSFVPLHGYRYLGDLRSTSEYWNLDDKLAADQFIYCGPGLWHNPETGRLHVRLAHTALDVLGDDNYHGEADPRRLPLVVGRDRSVLAVEGARHVVLRDLVVRGGNRSTLHVSGAEDLSLDRLWVYGGSPAVQIQDSRRVRITRCAIRGISAPWSFRTSHKYRGNAAYVLVVRGDGPPVEDLEIAYSELTDSHDGPFVGTARGLKFHHNLVDNFNDDGVYLTAMGVGGDAHIHQNRISRCLHAFSFFGDYPVGAGVWIYRNVIDLRGPVPYYQPASADDPRFVAGGRSRIATRGRLCGDHGSPTWEPIRFYHNTVLSAEPSFRDYYGAGWGGHLAGTERWVFNNVFRQTDAPPGLTFDPDALLHAGGNLLSGPAESQVSLQAALSAFRDSELFRASQSRCPPGWTVGDVVGDPRLEAASAEDLESLDVRLQDDSPAIDAGVALPADWPDPLRDSDAGRPDIGALPYGADAITVGPDAAE